MRMRWLSWKAGLQMSNVKYSLSADKPVAYGELPNGEIFAIDADMVEKINTVKFYLGSKGRGNQYYVIDCRGHALHDSKCGGTASLSRVSASYSQVSSIIIAASESVYNIHKKALKIQEKIVMYLSHK